MTGVGQIVDWQWDFGDSGTDNIKDPLHSYTLAGIYTVTVTVTEDSCTKTAQNTITVLNGTGLEEYTKEISDPKNKAEVFCFCCFSFACYCCDY